MTCHSQIWTAAAGRRCGAASRSWPAARRPAGSWRPNSRRSGSPCRRPAGATCSGRWVPRCCWPGWPGAATSRRTRAPARADGAGPAAASCDRRAVRRLCPAGAGRDMLPARPLPTTQQDGRVQERPISRRRLAAGTKI